MANSNQVEMIFSHREYKTHNLKIQTIFKSKKDKFKVSYTFLRDNFKSSFIEIDAWSEQNGWVELDEIPIENIVSELMNEHVKKGSSFDAVDEIETELDERILLFLNKWN